MPTIADYRDDCRADGLLVETVPDFLTNGHDGVKTLRDPSHGYLHHTVATVLQSVYWDRAKRPGWPASEWRPEVPAPRANLYVARARKGGCRPGCPYDDQAHLVFTSNGKAHHAGMANLSRIKLARAGRISAAVPTAKAAGLKDDFSGAGFESVGMEIDWNVGEDWPADLLTVVCRAMNVAVDTFDWPGIGSWIQHEQATDRKTDLAYTGDIWALGEHIGRQAPDAQEDDMQVPDLNAAAKLGQLDDFFTRQAQVSARYGLARGVDIRTAVAPLLAAISSAGVESGKRDAAVLAVLATLGKPQELSAEEFAAALAPLLAEQGVTLSEATIARAVRTELAGALAGPTA